MSDDFVYVKLQLEQLENDKKAVGSYLITTDLHRAEKWKAKKTKPAQDSLEETSPEETTELPCFSLLFEEIEKKIGKYYDFSVMFIELAKTSAALHRNTMLYDFSNKCGELIKEDDEFAFFKLPIEKIFKLIKKADEARNFSDGAKQIPENLFMGLVSSFDAFLFELIKCIFETQPNLLESSDKTIKLNQLIEYDNFDQLKSHMIDEIIEEILRGSHSDHIKWIEKKVKVNIRQTQIWSDYIELFERRNLLVHRSGKVSRQYLSVCLENNYDISQIEITQQLKVDAQYLLKSVDLLYEFAVKLVIVTWQKLIPKNKDSSIRELNMLSYNILSKNNYQLAQKLLEFGLYETSQDFEDSTRKMMIINYANSLKLSGDTEKAIDELDKEDWSATERRYKICVHAIKDDVEEVTKLMKKNVIEKDEFRDWPVFKTLKSNKMFIDAFYETYGEDLFSTSSDITG